MPRSAGAEPGADWTEGVEVGHIPVEGMGAPNEARVSEHCRICFYFVSKAERCNAMVESTIMPSEAMKEEAGGGWEECLRGGTWELW